MEVAADPVGESSLAIDGPVQHGATSYLLDQASQFGGVTGAQFACGNGSIEELLRFLADSFELAESDSAELGIGQVDLQIGEPVGYGFRRGGETGALHEQLEERLERRGEFRVRGGELRGHAGRSPFHRGEEQRALGAETLDEGGRHYPGFFGYVGEG